MTLSVSIWYQVHTITCTPKDGSRVPAFPDCVNQQNNHNTAKMGQFTLTGWRNYIYQVSFSDIVPQQQVEMFELFGASVVALCTPCGIDLWASAALRNTAFDRQVFRLLACWLMLANYVEGIWESVIAFTVFRWLLWKVDLGTF